MMNFKPLLIGVIAFAQLGCGEPSAVPDKAIKSCIEANGTPQYRSNPFVIEFNCIKPKPPKPKSPPKAESAA